jgi:diketogulonate reductase-like aldo/keto reductase
LKRADLFVVTKLPLMAMTPDDVKPFVEMSLKALCLDYVDLYLVHSPLGVEMDRKTGGLKQVDGKVTVLWLSIIHFFCLRPTAKLSAEGLGITF